MKAGAGATVQNEVCFPSHRFACFFSRSFSASLLPGRCARQFGDADQKLIAKIDDHLEQFVGIKDNDLSTTILELCKASADVRSAFFFVVSATRYLTFFGLAFRSFCSARDVRWLPGHQARRLRVPR